MGAIGDDAAALDDDDHVRRTLELNEIGIEYLTAELGKMLNGLSNKLKSEV